MADNVIPFPVQHRRPDAMNTGTEPAADDQTPVTREEMIQLVLRYAYGTSWAQEAKTADKAGDD